ncbi:DoxX family protein [Salinibacter ruber]|uniref:Membrane protein n=1 Tax=Salinibacter ruber TaxID=146919 RepID=A0A9X2ULN7_9BACT|nr:DoxX family protein [Salinibacter ruber]MBB4089668.1 putative membrane protein [Salinibacter ruber]MCS3610454.1 putative membrane protein [Salinibacter ruber]MCS3614702.1 putative membrane protein [Salinibacter ruber]MCS3627673.1 putative membrane protein [Salinibacter ruber]MCS3640431.1 putative membrane protein [Salinibacter ruber]
MHRFSVYLIALLFAAAGTAHFVRPSAFARIVPPYLPAPYALVYVSGAAELLGALGVLVPGLRRYAGWGLLLLALAVFPANVHMALHPADFEGIPAWALYLRLPLQVALVGWIYWALGLRIRT